jgi:WD40 repeat protein
MKKSPRGCAGFSRLELLNRLKAMHQQHLTPFSYTRASAIVVLWISLLGLVAGAEPPVTAIAFTPDGQSVLVGSQSGVVVHSWPELQRQRSLETRLLSIHDLAFSPDGSRLAAAGGFPAEQGLVEIFSWPGGESLLSLDSHTDSVLAVDWDSDSSLATASLDHEIALWDVDTAEATQRLRGHSRGVTCLCFLKEKQMLISGSIDQNLRVWDTNSFAMIRTLNNHTKEIRDLALRPGEGLPMVASVGDDRTVRLWQPTIGRLVRFAQLGAPLLAVDWLPDGSHVAVAGADGRVRLIDPDTVEVVEEIVAVDGWAYSLCAHPTDGSLLVGGRGGQLKRITPDEL